MKSLQISCTRKSKALIWGTLTFLLLLSAILSLCVGSVKVPLEEVVRTLFGGYSGSTAARIVRFTRLPRTCAAMLAGAALAVSGAVIQTVLYNPLASPSIIGVNSSAGLAAALVCAIGPTAQQFAPLAAFLGALLGALLILSLAQSTGASRMTVVLAGVVVSNLFSAGIDALVTLVPDALNGVSDFRIGGFSGVTMTRLAPAAGMILISLVLTLSLSQELDILSLGSDVAQSLGLSVRSVRFLLLALAAALAGAAVSFSGLLGFVGLVVPHAVRRILGGESFPLLLGSMLGGASFLTICDLLSRVLFAPFEIPVGIVLAFIGAPFFLWLLLRKKGGKV